jgi:hypothetical protein
MTKMNQITFKTFEDLSDNITVFAAVLVTVFLATLHIANADPILSSISAKLKARCNEKYDNRRAAVSKSIFSTMRAKAAQRV